MKKQKIYAPLLVLVILVLQACNLPRATPESEPTPNPLEAAEMTVTALAQRTPTTALFPTFTPLPTLTSTPAFTATPAFTSTPTFPFLTLSEATNCRVGPATAYDKVDTFTVGQTIEVLGKHPFDNYWFVRSPNNAGVNCWMWGFYATGGNLGSVPVFTPPPSPTPAPSFDASYKSLSSCVGWWARINLKNTGGTAFKSMTITIKDTVADVTLTDTRDSFQDTDGCLLSSITSTLDAGSSYTISSPAFTADPTGHKMTATIKLCTQPGLGGSCSSKSIEFTP